MKEKKSPSSPSFKEAIRFWFKLGWISFGGTLGHINIMHDFLVEKKKWISSSRFFHALSLCMLLPGPEAQQLAIYIGWKLHGKRGGILAGIFFILPSMFILLALSCIYVTYGNQSWMDAIFSGLKPAVVAIIFHAVWSVGRKALHTVSHYLFAGIAFASIFFFDISMPYIILGTITAALILRYFWPSLVYKGKALESHEILNEEEYYINHKTEGGKDFNAKLLWKQCSLFILLWVIPFLLFYILSPDFTFWKGLVLFFTQTALFTIGGSYTVLPYVAQFSVSKFNWLSKSQMVDGFALAETTPGPLIIVVCYVGFMAGYNHFDGSLLMGTVGLLATTFYTFLPSFLFIFVGGPILERTRGSQVISDVLGFVTAAVVGVILNLTFYLGKDVLFPLGMMLNKIDLMALLWVVISLILIFKFRLNIVWLILLSMLYGWLQY
ncbi:chromate efflux transporter [Pedobacter caeni]|uniref:Chromate transporter n=1 Tax=Pedobacter caeni TaxID=288992 RepID=A0A1M4U0F7_9SPHI|nr:chromate efflux transporter [Pedobacter caeni]SHE50077.1 chromate transporter [Pedobacter caeni]